jgi:predicted cupin superfamily sugar epimerase
MLSAAGAAIVAKLGLIPHPEGGHYRETWRGPDTVSGRATATAILFMLDTGERSHWHSVDADEIWLWHGGSPLLLERAASGDGPIETIRLGPDVLAGESPQAVIPAGGWQATGAPDGWGLVSCVVAPGFDFAGFRLAPPDWAPGAGDPA